ncbi:MAG: hypothetical protein ABFS32_04755 [Bacteroidota bacterium]
MIRLFTISVLAFFMACSNGNNNSLSDEGEMVPLLPADAQLEPLNDGSGLVKATVYAGERIIEQGYYLNGYRVGVYTTFFPKNEFVESMTGYVNGKKQGQSTLLDDRGQVQEVFTYNNDVLHGQYIKFNRTRLKEKKDYVNGMLEGKVEKFYANGKIMERSLYKAGKLHGVSRWYDQQGKNTIASEYNMNEHVKDVALEPAPTPR